MGFPIRAKYPLIIALSIAIAGSAFFIAHKPHKQIVSSFSIASIAEQPFITGFSFTEYGPTGKKFTINAQRCFLRNKKVEPFGFRIALGRLAEMEAVEAIFYKDDHPVSRIYSKTAIIDIKKGDTTIDIKKKNITFEGKPVLVTEDKKTLTAKKIIWNNSENRIYAEGNCVLGVWGARHFAESISTDKEIISYAISGGEKIWAGLR